MHFKFFFTLWYALSAKMKSLTGMNADIICTFLCKKIYYENDLILKFFRNTFNNFCTHLSQKVNIAKLQKMQGLKLHTHHVLSYFIHNDIFSIFSTNVKTSETFCNSFAIWENDLFYFIASFLFIQLIFLKLFTIDWL